MKKVYGSIWILSLILMFYLGQNSVNPVSSDKKVSDNPKAKNTQSLNDEAKINSPAATQQRRVNTQRDRSETYLLDRLEELRSYFPLKRYGDPRHDETIAKACSLFRDLSEKELKDVMDLMRNDFIRKENAGLVEYFLAYYAIHNPQEALRICKEEFPWVNDREIFSAWSAASPQESYAKLQEKPGNFTGYLTTFRELATHDLQDAIRKYEKLKGKTERFHAWVGFSEFLNSNGQYSEFLELSLKTNDHELKENVIQQWMAKKTLEEADSFLATLQESTRGAMIPLFAKSRANKNPQEALTWLENQKSVNFQPALQKVLERAYFSDQNFYKEQLPRLNDENARITLTENIYKRIKSRHQINAKKFLEASPYKEKVLKRLHQ